VDRETVSGTAQEQRLYELIWKRTIASQMADAELEKTTATIRISGVEAKFVATGEVVTFDGFLRVYRESYDDDTEAEDESRLLPPLAKGDELEREELLATQRFTQSPLRYTEASLVRKLEELGIGRPSTYAPTISTIQQRGYVEKGNREGTKRSYDILKLKGNKITESTKNEVVGNEKNKLLPTDIGIVVNDFLMQYFPEILDYNFTANVEKEFDEVAEGQEEWSVMMESFYKSFHPLVDKTMHAKTERKVGERVLGNDPVSGKPVSVKIGRFGPVIQIGTVSDEEKPRFAQLKKGLSMETITLEEALESFKLPRQLGEWEDHVVTVGVGRFGPYVRHEKTFVSIPKDIDPMSITLTEATHLLMEKRRAEQENFIKGFEEEPNLRVLNGRYGPYISFMKKNYKIPEGVAPEDLTVDACMKIVALQQDKADARRHKSASGKTPKAATAKTKK
jgi:DNA topoisomerase-1